jgi:hypothetical protein
MKKGAAHNNGLSEAEMPDLPETNSTFPTTKRHWPVVPIVVGGTVTVMDDRMNLENQNATISSMA